MELEQVKETVVAQAKAKNWNNETEYLLEEKFQEELKELKFAIASGKQEDVAEEVSDLVIVLFQVAHNEAKDQNLNYAMAKKIEHNWTHKKKTKDKETGKVVKR